MAITPKEAMKLNPEDMAKISALEKKIDATLKKEFADEKTRVIVCTDYLDRRTQVQLYQIYENAGWNVKYNTEQREGAWLEFTARGDRGN